MIKWIRATCLATACMALSSLSFSSCSKRASCSDSSWLGAACETPLPGKLHSLLDLSFLLRLLVRDRRLFFFSFLSALRSTSSVGLGALRPLDRLRETDRDGVCHSRPRCATGLCHVASKSPAGKASVGGGSKGGAMCGTHRS